MAKYKILGIEHLSGTSKKTNKPYDMDILHCVEINPPRGNNIIGNRVDKITVSRDSGFLTKPPVPGSVYDIVFNRFGRVEFIDPVD